MATSARCSGLVNFGAIDGGLLLRVMVDVFPAASAANLVAERSPRRRTLQSERDRGD